MIYSGQKSRKILYDTSSEVSRFPANDHDDNNSSAAADADAAADDNDKGDDEELLAHRTSPINNIKDE